MMSDEVGADDICSSWSVRTLCHSLVLPSGGAVLGVQVPSPSWRARLAYEVVAKKHCGKCGGPATKTVGRGVVSFG